jgi:hypothetical protein
MCVQWAAYEHAKHEQTTCIPTYVCLYFVLLLIARAPRCSELGCVTQLLVQMVLES